MPTIKSKFHFILFTSFVVKVFLSNICLVDCQDSYVLCKIFNKKGDLNDCSPSVISNVVEETPRLTELPFGNDLYLGEWSGLMEASLANQQGASQEVVTDALMKNFETQHVGASVSLFQ